MQILAKKTTYCALFHGSRGPTIEAGVAMLPPHNINTSPQLWLQTCDDLGSSNSEILQMNDIPSAETSDLATFCELARANVKADENQQLLVAVAWCTREGRKIFEAFPETLFVDGTHKTNAQSFTLITAGVKDNNGQMHIVFRAFVPNERNWLFRWLFQSAFVQVLGARKCQKVRLVITDGDSQEISQLDAALRTVFTSAYRRRCGWHIVHKGFLAYVGGLGKSKAAKDVAAFIKARIYSMMKDVETEEEYQE